MLFSELQTKCLLKLAKIKYPRKLCNYAYYNGPVKRQFYVCLMYPAVTLGGDKISTSCAQHPKQAKH